MAEANAYGGTSVRNVMIDLLPVAGQAASVAYKIAKAP